MDKLVSNTIHALNRVRERYHVPLSKNDLDAILLQIKTGVGVKRFRSPRDTLRRKCWDVTYKERTFRLVVEENRKAGRYCIVTFLPPP